MSDARKVFFRQLHRIAGYIECGEGESVTFSQDDATKGWSVKVGSAAYHGDTLEEAFDKALAAANEHYESAYGMDEV